MTFTEAVELGSTMIRLVPGVWLEKDCGCFTGMAGYANGIRRTTRNNPEMEIFAVYPWLHESHLLISALAFDVAGGQKTFAQALEIIRAMDPDEQAKLKAVKQGVKANEVMAVLPVR